MRDGDEKAFGVGFVVSAVARWMQARSSFKVSRQRNAEIFIAVPTVAVGTTIADRPPHRTVRAAFPHTAPTLDE
jgi:hypothetical protein